MKVFFSLLLLLPFYLGTFSRADYERKFVVSMSNFEPLNFRKDGQRTGLDFDVMHALELRTHSEFSQQELSRPATMESFYRGRADIVSLTVRNDAYDKLGDFLPIYKGVPTLTVQKNSIKASGKIEDYLADPKIKIAMIIGVRSLLTETEEKKLIGEGRFVGVPEPEGAFKLLQQGRVQAVFQTEFPTDYFVKKFDLKDKTIKILDEKRAKEIGIYLSKRRAQKGDREIFQKAITAMKNDGSLEKILIKYVGAEGAKERLEN